MFHIVLLEPEIPHNTGAVGRLCVATGARLHLVKPLGFSLDDKYVRRTGLDYWPRVKLSVWEDFEELVERNRDAQFRFLTTKACRSHWGVDYRPDDFLVFGSESRGLPEGLLARNEGDCLRIPMCNDGAIRSLNLATSVAIVLYEGLRTIGFTTCQT